MAGPYKGIGRNDPCPCGSGKKYKKCCLVSAGPTQPAPALPRVDPATRPWSDGRFVLEPATEELADYDPFTEPVAEQWLAMDEQEQIDAVMAYHRAEGTEVPNADIHAGIHVVVENQIADADLPVRRIAERLMSEGLDRHEAIHAIGSVLIGYIHDLMSAPDQVAADPKMGYFAELEELTAEKWLQSG